MIEPKPQIKALSTPQAFDYLITFLTLGKQHDISNLKSGSYSAFKSPELFFNSIEFLTSLGFFELKGTSLIYKKEYSREAIQKELFFFLSNTKRLHQFFPPGTIQFSSLENMIMVNNRMIPIAYSPYRNLLIRLGFFQKEQKEHLFSINSLLKEWFLNNIVPLIENDESNFTLEQLKRTLNSNEVFGEEAEHFVLTYERKRMAAHPRATSIRQISKDHSAAGYDIKSFLHLNSVTLDKEIEVKSYSGENAYFYWSKNELERAKKSQHRYYLYLVNRNKIKEHNYKPQIIKNPYKTIFNSASWEKTIDCYFFKQL